MTCCFAGEPGELVGKVVKGNALREFDGYANEKDTKKKLAYNIFAKGDCYFLTGMQLDSIIRKLLKRFSD